MQSLKGFSIPSEGAIDPREMRALELNSAYFGVPVAELMENAGRSVADFVRKRTKAGSSVLVVCGTGNNGGDGFVAARYLKRGYKVKIVLFGDRKKIKGGAALANFNKVRHMVTYDASAVGKLAKEAQITIVGIYGTGFRGSLNPAAKRVISSINNNSHRIVAIDVPSGTDATTGKGAGIRADYTVTFHRAKRGLLKSRNAGKVVVADIGIPGAARLHAGPGDVALATEPLSRYANKYTRGSVLVVGGSEEYRGAPMMAAFSANNALSALTTGSGYVTIAAPKSVVETAARRSSIFVFKVLSGEMPDYDFSIVKGIRHNTVIIGPGMKVSEVNRSLVERILKFERMNGGGVVVDGGALSLIGRFREKPFPGMVLTPHDGEFKKLTRRDLKGKPLQARIMAAMWFARLRGCTLVLKGNTTVVTDGKRLKLNTAKTPALSTMGTGDVLDGIIAGFLSRHADAFESAVAGVFVHAKIGDELYKRKGLHIVAQDVIDAIPDALKGFDVITDK